MSDEHAFLDATAQADLVRRGEVTPAELVEAARVRIEVVNPEINAVIHRLDEKAATEAGGGDLPDGPFRGVPFLVKDAVCHTAGDPYHCGMQFLKDRNWTAETDAYLAQKFRRAGFVFVGKTNLPELATSVTTEPLAYGATRNPWNVAHSTGGSSGGSAAAVAAGLVPVAHANDMGGSIRAPASECGLVGLKPTRARTSLGPGFGEFWGPLTHEGVVTRSVRDTAAVLDAIAGSMPGDPYTAPAPVRPFASELGADPGVLSIAVRTGAIEGMPAVDPEIVAAVDSVGRLLEELGHRVEGGGPTALDDDVNRGFFPVFASAVARDLDRWSERTGDPIGPTDVEPPNWRTAEFGRAVSGPAYLEAVEQLQADSRRLAAWWKYHDLLVTPTIGVLPPPLGVMAPDGALEQSLPLMAQITQFLMPWNITGQPAISLPLAVSASGLPIGVQLIAATGREDLLIRVASQLEQAAPWSDRLPPVHA
jgi:amidase